MWFVSIRGTLRRVWSRTLRDFIRALMLDEERLPLDLEDICHTCPVSRHTADRQSDMPSDEEQIDACRKRFFAVLLQSYAGRPGSHETDLLYSYWKACEECAKERYRESIPIWSSETQKNAF